MKILKINILKKKHCNVRDHCHYTGEYGSIACSIHNSKYCTPKEITVIFSIIFSKYDYHFIIKELGWDFEEQFTCFGENTEKYIALSFPIGKEVTKISKKRKETTRTIFYKLKFIESIRFMASSLLNLTHTFADRIHQIKRTYGYDNKKCEMYRIKDCECSSNFFW